MKTYERGQSCRQSYIYGSDENRCQKRNTQGLVEQKARNSHFDEICPEFVKHEHSLSNLFHICAHEGYSRRVIGSVNRRLGLLLIYQCLESR